MSVSRPEPPEPSVGPVPLRRRAAPILFLVMAMVAGVFFIAPVPARADAASIVVSVDDDTVSGFNWHPGDTVKIMLEAPGGGGALAVGRRSTVPGSSRRTSGRPVPTSCRLHDRGHVDGLDRRSDAHGFRCVGHRDQQPVRHGARSRNRLRADLRMDRGAHADGVGAGHRRREWQVVRRLRRHLGHRRRCPDPDP